MRKVFPYYNIGVENMKVMGKEVTFFGYDFSDFKMNVLFVLVALIGGIVTAGIALAVYDLSKKGFPIAG